MLSDSAPPPRSAVSEEVPRVILNTLTHMGGELFTPAALTAAHGGLVSAMATLASAGSGQGHVPLFAACADWLKTWYVRRALVGGAGARPLNKRWG